MNTIRKLLMACMLIGGLGVASALLAAEINLPELGVNPAQAKAARAQEGLKRDAICTRCHDETETKPVLSIYQTKHGVRGDSRSPTCQSCHGDSEKHLAGDKDGKGRPATDIVFKKGVYAASDEKDRASQCLTCHKGGKRTNWDGGKHEQNGMACNDCHQVHQPADKLLSKKTQAEVCFTCHKEQRADTHKISTHPIDAGKVTCSDCHNPHGGVGPKLLKKNTVNETCFTCHAEKRGPFLWEHQPATEDCTNCHTPHGSNLTPLLKNRPPFLCDDCHDGPHNSQAPYGTGAAGLQGGLIGATPVSPATKVNPNTSASGRACMNCHVIVHGSNSPAGALLHR